MKSKNVGNITVNDGCGLYDNEGLIDTLIIDCNNLVKVLAGGNYVQFCSIVVQMVQKLSNLKSGIKNDLDSKNNVIEELKNQLRHCGQEVEDMTAEEYILKYGKKDGAE